MIKRGRIGLVGGSLCGQSLNRLDEEERERKKMVIEID